MYFMYRRHLPHLLMGLPGQRQVCATYIRQVRYETQDAEKVDSTHQQQHGCDTWMLHMLQPCYQAIRWTVAPLPFLARPAHRCC
jgi:hypothetical protein